MEKREKVGAVFFPPPNSVADCPSGSTRQFRFDSPAPCPSEQRRGPTALINTTPSPSTLTGFPSLPLYLCLCCLFLFSSDCCIIFLNVSLLFGALSLSLLVQCAQVPLLRALVLGMDTTHEPAFIAPAGHMAGLMTASACVKSAQGGSVSWQHPTACLFRAAPWDESHLCPDVFSCRSGPMALSIPLSLAVCPPPRYVPSLLHLLPAPLLPHLSPVTSLPASSSIFISPSPPPFSSHAAVVSLGFSLPLSPCSYLNERPPSVSLSLCVLLLSRYKRKACCAYQTESTDNQNAP